jgi:hypothetical protein
VGGNVLRGLDANLKRVLDEAPLLDVFFDSVDVGESAELGQARFHERELLQDQIGVGHARGPSR